MPTAQFTVHRRSKSHRVIWARLTPTAAVLVAIVALSGCGHPKRTPPPPFVATTTASNGNIQPTSQLAGIIAPYENVAIQTTLVEPADAVNVQEGDTVTTGEVLAQLDTADLQAELASDEANTSHDVYQGGLNVNQGTDAISSASAAVTQAQANVARDQRDLTRYDALYKSGYVSQQQYQDQQATVRDDQGALGTAIANLSSARSQAQANGTLATNGLQSTTVAEAQAQAQQVRVQIGKATIVSPIDGVVVNRNLNPGEYPGTRQIFTLQQVDPIFAIVHGSGAQIAQIQTGTTALVQASDLGAQRLVGKVIGVLNQIVPGSTDFEVKILLQNADHKLRPGMAVAANIDLPKLNGIRIPETAFTDENHTTIITVTPESVVKVVHVTEIGNDGNTSVISGIPVGTHVITNGTTSVGDGEKVSLK